MADKFNLPVKDLLAKRVGMACSNPDCRRPTTGPSLDGGITNIGIAAHIHAAAEGGARFKKEQTKAERSSVENGIWLCQPCAKIIDDDENKYSENLLRQWKDISEKIASLETIGYSVSKGRSFSILEKKMPELIDEMRTDLSTDPFVRRFVTLSKKHVYGGDREKVFCYYFEEHENLKGKLLVAQNYNAVLDITYNNTDRYEFTEDFAEYLLGEIQ